MLSGRVHIAKAPQASLTVKAPKKTLGRKLQSVLLAAVLVSLGATSAGAADFFDWLGEPTNPVPNPPPASPTDRYVTGPTLNDSTGAAVDGFLAAQQGAGRTLAVKVRAGTVLGAPSLALYNKYNIKYTFGDYEGVSAVPQATNLVAQIKASTVTGPNVIAGTSYVGNYQIAPLPADPTRPATPVISGNGSGSDGTAGPNPFYGTTEF